jgi:hypothetical protein
VRNDQPAPAPVDPDLRVRDLESRGGVSPIEGDRDLKQRQRPIELLNESWPRSAQSRRPALCDGCSEAIDDGDEVVHNAGSVYHARCTAGPSTD